MAAIPAILINDTRVDMHHGCTRVVTGLISCLGTQDIQLAGSVSAHQNWRLDPQVCDSIAAAKLIVVNGEGTLHHDAPQARILLEVAQFAAGEGVPAVLVNCLWERNNIELGGLLADFALISARDSSSAAEIHSLGYACRCVPDLSLYEPVSPPAESRTGIGVTDSVVREISILLDTYRKREKGIPVSIHQRAPGLPGLWDHWLRGRPWSGLRDPRSFFLAASMRLSQGRACMDSTDRFVQKLGELRGLVSGRFHACTLSLLSETPFVALPSNTAKIESLIRDAGLDPSRILSPEIFTTGSVLPDWSWRDSELRSLREYVVAGRADMLALASDIRKLL